MTEATKKEQLKELKYKDRKRKRGILARRIFAIAMIVGTLIPLVSQIVSAGL